MKTIVFALLISVGGCMAGTGITPNYPDTSAVTGAADMSSPPTVIDTSTPNLGPQIVISATGSGPVLATPIGGNTYLPITGGAPITGISTSP